jgi:hypothetical protein
VVFELWSRIPPDDTSLWTYAAIQARPVDEWLAQQPGTSVILEYPLGENLRSTAMMRQIFNRQGMVLGGMAPSFRMALLYERANRIVSFPSAESLAALHEWQTKYVLVTPALIESEEAKRTFQIKLAKFPELELVANMDGVFVYEIKEKR